MTQLSSAERHTIVNTVGAAIEARGVWFTMEYVTPIVIQPPVGSTTDAGLARTPPSR